MIEDQRYEQLPLNATVKELEQAAAFNHTQLFSLNARSVGGTVHLTGGVKYTHGADILESMIAFPDLSDAGAAATLDEIMAFYTTHPPKGIGCWSLEPTQPKDLGIRLLARGFQPGWRPNWMALDLRELQLSHVAPEGLEVIADNTTSLQAVKELPYGDTETAIFSVQNDDQCYLQRFIARLNNEVVGHCSVLVTKGKFGCAGVYHVGVVPPMRNRGIGKAVVGAACKYAGDHGYHYALLNGTGEKMYRQLGFRKVGNGRTWWLVWSRFLDQPPTLRSIEFAEAIGRGDLNAMRVIEKNISSYNLHDPLSNGMSPMELAVVCRQPASAEWLISRGVSINVIDAWDLGWRAMAAKILAEQPEQANKLGGDGGWTILHTAVERNDMTLAKMVLSARPDLTIRDNRYKATVLEWSVHLNRKEMALLLEQYAAEAAKK